MQLRTLLFGLSGFFFLQMGLAQTPSLPESEIRAIEHGLTPSVLEAGKPVETYSIQERMDSLAVPGVSIALVKDGELKWVKGYGIANAKTGSRVDENTLFQAASISKPLSALAALKLVEQGKITLDEDVNPYLKGWHIPESLFLEEEKVSLRRLLTHTAGMTVHGFPGYKSTDKFPSIIQVLNGGGNTDPILVDTVPESIWRYSGGGYTVMEKVVEDISGMPFEDFMEKDPPANGADGEHLRAALAGVISCYRQRGLRFGGQSDRWTLAQLSGAGGSGLMDNTQGTGPIHTTHTGHT